MFNTYGQNHKNFEEHMDILEEITEFGQHFVQKIKKALLSISNSPPVFEINKQKNAVRSVLTWICEVQMTSLNSLRCILEANN